MDAIIQFINDEKIFILILAFAVFYIVAQSYYAENYSNEMQKVIYFFHAKWCSHCVKTMPIIEELIKEYENNSNVKFKLIDEAHNKEMLKKFNIQSFPTIIMVKDGENYHFSGQRTKQNLKNFIDM